MNRPKGKRVTESKNSRFLKKFWVPITVVVVGLLLLIIAPWQTQIPEPTPEPTPPPVVVETPMEDPPEVPVLDETPTPPPETPTPDPDLGRFNPLTGEVWNEDLSRNRPWAVVIGNTAEALPQMGIGQADIMCEYVVEGASRFMAIYQDISHVGTIGGIRSLRTSSMEIAQSFDAIFAHWIGRTYDNVETSGSPVTIYGTINASSGGIGYRYTGKPAPHNGVTSGERLIYGLPASFRTEHEEGYKRPFVFADDGTPEDGEKAETVVVSFYKNSKTTTFTYNKDDGKYGVTQFNRPLIDGNDEDENELQFTNIIIINTKMQFGYNPSGHTYVETTGRGDGFFVCGGKYTEITWSRRDVNSQYVYTLKDGTPLELGVGKTFICIIRDDVVPEFS